MSDNKLTFESEEKRLEAMEALEDTPDNLPKLEEIINAEIAGKTEDTPVNYEPEVSEQPEVPEPPAETSPEIKEKKVVKPPKEEFFTIKREELPERFRDKNPQEVFKSHLHQDDLIDRQGKKIEKLLEELDALKRNVAEPLKPTEPKKEEPKPQAPQVKSKVADIAKLKQELAELDDPYDEKAWKKRLELDTFMTEELTNSVNTITNLQTEINNLKSHSESLAKKFDDNILSKKHDVALENEYRQIDELGKNKEYEEFKLTRNSKEIETEYLDWGNRVAIQYYGRKAANNNEIQNALSMLANESPDLIKKCEEANIPIKPSRDVETYINICEMLDYRDGYRKNPDGTYKRLMKYDPYTKTEIPDTFPSLQDAIENKRIRDGYYKKKEVDAFRSGGKQMVEAIQRRDTSEFDNTQGGQAQLSVAELTKKFDEFDENLALEKLKEGDDSMIKEYNELRIQFGMKPIKYNNT